MNKKNLLYQISYSACSCKNYGSQKPHKLDYLIFFPTSCKLLHTLSRKRLVRKTANSVATLAMHFQLALQWNTLKSKLFSVYHCKAVNMLCKYGHSAARCRGHTMQTDARAHSVNTVMVVTFMCGSGHAPHVARGRKTLTFLYKHNMRKLQSAIT